MARVERNKRIVIWLDEADEVTNFEITVELADDADELLVGRDRFTVHSTEVGENVRVLLRNAAQQAVTEGRTARDNRPAEMPSPAEPPPEPPGPPG